jgi:hypothetical protein
LARTEAAASSMISHSNSRLAHACDSFQAFGPLCCGHLHFFQIQFGDRNQVLHFEKDLALGGVFLILWVRGAARLSLDALLARFRRDAAPDLVETRSKQGGV